MANSGPDTNGSQFFINQTTPEAYKNNGGFSAFENQWANIKAQLENYKDSELFSAFVQQYGTYCYNTDVISDDIKSFMTITAVTHTLTALTTQLTEVTPYLHR